MTKPRKLTPEEQVWVDKFGLTRRQAMQKPHNAKQIAARHNNWRIFQLRGAYDIMQGTYVEERFRAEVDNCLKGLGAESETDRRERLRQEYELERAQRKFKGHPANHG